MAVVVASGDDWKAVVAVEAVAAAAVEVDAHEHYGHKRPPFGAYGPWDAPKGVGLLPTFNRVAMRQPLQFRRTAPIPPLMGLTVPWIRR